MRKLVLALLMLFMLAGQGVARLTESAPRPMPRPAVEAMQTAAPARPLPRPGAMSPVAVQVRFDATIRPQPRPVRQPQAAPVPLVQPIATSPRPVARPKGLRRKAAITPVALHSPSAAVAAGGKGRVCGDRRIRGQSLASIPGRISGCGVSAPVRVSAVDGVALTRPATMDCTTAKALSAWIRDGVKPIVGRRGGGVASIDVIASYACRTRNNRPGAKISEHGRGRAVDVAAINLKNGTSLSVLTGWNHPRQGKLLKEMHAAACGPFGTVLGPRSDRYHQNHFHLDTARYRSGPYCR